LSPSSIVGASAASCPWWGVGITSSGRKALVRFDTPRGLVRMGCLLNDRLGNGLELVGEEVVIATRLGELIHAMVERGGRPVSGNKSPSSAVNLRDLVGMSIGLDRSSAIANREWP
jgi:hypothetical protein